MVRMAWAGVSGRNGDSAGMVEGGGWGREGGGGDEEAGRGGVAECDRATSGRCRSADGPQCSGSGTAGGGDRVATGCGTSAGRAGRGRSRRWCCCFTWPPCWPVRVGVPPSSELERAIADGFSPYFDLMDLGYSYRFYAEPPPTPVVTATIQYGDGRPEETVRLPGRDVPGPADAAPAAARAGQCACTPTSRRPGGGSRTPARAGWPGPMPGTSAGPVPAAGA